MLNQEVTAFNHYRDYLKQVLVFRQKKNPLYSMRALARDLDMATSSVSEILSGKKTPSVKMARNIAERLGLKEDEQVFFVDLVVKEKNISADELNLTLKRLESARKNYTVVDLEYFKFIADWYHNALLELTELDDFEYSPHWIGKKLGIPPELAMEGVERLLKLGLIKRDGQKLVKTHEALTTTSDIPSAAIREHHSQILEKAEAALHSQAVTERDFSTMTFAIDKSKLPVAKEKIRAFRREMAELLESGKKDEVYTMAIQLFQLKDDVL